MNTGKYTMRMYKKKIFNDPVYGFLGFPHHELYEVIDSPAFQRLRRISQMGFTQMVYPGAVHTRFHHTLGALHLMTRALNTLKSKSIIISEEESKAACLAILCHDIGHGPFSHALEKQIIYKSHESLSLEIMNQLNIDFKGQFDLAIKIFTNQYERPFFHQLVASQLDVDRLDYLSRDSFFTGVVEGTVGYDRIIQMFHVYDDRLVVEEKGLYSVEKFLLSRRTMYWQVYLHKTSLVAEKMLSKLVQRAKELIIAGEEVHSTRALKKLLKAPFDDSSQQNVGEQLDAFLQLDDTDILHLIKENQDSSDFVLSYLCRSLSKRQLFRVKLSNTAFSDDVVNELSAEAVEKLNIQPEHKPYLILTGYEQNQSYNTRPDQEILMLMKDGSIKNISELSGFFTHGEISGKHYFCWPRV
jgi:uncharacterized protein